MSDETRMEVELAEDERNSRDVFKLGEPSAYTCPSCAGSLLRVRNATPNRFRCHTGHGYTALALEDELREKVENTAWSAVRSLQEHAMLLQELIKQPVFSDDEIADYRARADVAIARAEMLREALALSEDSKDSTSPKK